MLEVTLHWYDQNRVPLKMLVDEAPKRDAHFLHLKHSQSGISEYIAIDWISGYTVEQIDSE